MIIDQTRYDAFWANPEKYRLTYECNLVPCVLPYGLARGIAMHTIAEELAQGKTREEVDLILQGKIPGSRGMIQEPINEHARTMAWALWDELDRQYPLFGDPNCRLVASEAEFKFQIPGSRHFMAGRIDQIIERNGQLWCGEFKTANAKKSFDKVSEEWQQKSQADFEIIGARSLGYNVEGVWVRTIVEKNPPVVWPLEVRRSEHALQYKMLQVHETCETIELYRNVFGIDNPWPHVPFNWPCCKGGACEYERICGRRFSELTEADLEDFKPRKEHLDCMNDVDTNLPAVQASAVQVVAVR
jgi:hypothetical protein